MCRYALFFYAQKGHSFLPFKELSGYKKQGYKPLDPDKNGLVTLPICCWFISSTRNYRFVLPILLSAAHLVISSGRLSAERTAWLVYF